MPAPPLLGPPHLSLLHRCDLLSTPEASGVSLDACVRVFGGQLTLTDCCVVTQSYIGVLCEYPDTRCHVEDCKVVGGTFGCVARDHGAMSVVGCSVCDMVDSAVQGESGAALIVQRLSAEGGMCGVMSMTACVVEDCAFAGMKKAAVALYQTKGMGVVREGCRLDARHFRHWSFV